MDRGTSFILPPGAGRTGARCSKSDVRSTLNADPRRRVFGYALLDGKYASGKHRDCDIIDDEENVAAFERGEDRFAFDRLMGNLNANAARGKENLVRE